jgi:HTH-type transcriptional regulator/antitoxin HigA
LAHSEAEVGPHYAIAEVGHTQTELAEILGSRSRASEVLSRQRALTTKMIYRVHNTWKIPPELLIKPYKVRKAA